MATPRIEKVRSRPALRSPFPSLPEGMLPLSAGYPSLLICARFPGGRFPLHLVHGPVRKRPRGGVPHAPHLIEASHGVRLKLVDLPFCICASSVHIACHAARQRPLPGLEGSSARLARSTARAPGHFTRVSRLR